MKDVGYLGKNKQNSSLYELKMKNGYRERGGRGYTKIGRKGEKNDYESSSFLSHLASCSLLIGVDLK